MSEEIIKTPENVAEPVRTIEVITAEIVTIKRQAQQIALYIAIELGRRLTEAKALLDHGQWGPWLEGTVQFSQRSADNYMKLFEAYADKQTSIFGAEVNSQPVANLSIRKALALLAVPEEEREAFVVENHVDELSTRQMDELIEDYKSKLRAAEDAKVRADTEVQGMKFSLNKAVADAEKAERERDELARQLKELEARPVPVAVQEPDPAEIQAKVDAAVKEAMADEKAKAKDLRAKLKAAEERADALAREAEDGRNKATEAAEALAERDRLREQLRAAEKKLALSDAAVAQFGVLFQQSQDVMNKLLEAMGAVADADTAARLRQAAGAMLRKFLEAVDTEAA